MAKSAVVRGEESFLAAMEIERRFFWEEKGLWRGAWSFIEF